MRRWKDVAGCSVKERRDTLVQALRESPNRTLAARALGVNRQYLYELLLAYGIPTRPDSVERPDRPDSIVTPDTVGTQDSPDSVGRTETRGAVGATLKDSLTYVRPAPTLALTMSTAVATTETREGAAAEPTVRVNLDWPKDVNDWVEREALAEKQRTGASRASKSAVVIDMIRRRMREQRGGESE